MNELELYVASLQDQGLSVDEIKAKVIEWKKQNQADETEVVEETTEEVDLSTVKKKDGVAGADVPSEIAAPKDTGSKLDLGLLDLQDPVQPTPAPFRPEALTEEEKALENKRRQELKQNQQNIDEKPIKSWEENFVANVKSPNFTDLNIDQVQSIQDKAIEELTSKYSEDEDFSFDPTDVRLKSISIFENQILPKVSFEKDTKLETFVKDYIPILNPYADFISDLYTSVGQGWKTSGLVDPTFELLKKGSETPDIDIINWINKNKEIASETIQSDEMRDFNKTYKENGSGVFGFIKGVANNPSILPSLLASSIATQVGSLRSEEVALAAGAGAATGAATGAAVGAIGGPLAGVTASAGAIGGAIAGGAGAMEASLTFSELLQEEVGDDLTLEAVKELFEDEERVGDLQRKAIARGITIGLVEGITGGIAKGVTGKVLKAGLSKPVGTTAGLGVETVGGSTGEVLGRIAAGQKMDIAEIGFEGVAGLGSAPLTVGSELVKLNNSISKYKLKKELKNTDFEKVSQAFNPEFPTTSFEIKASQEKNSLEIINKEVDLDVREGNITKDQGNNIKNRAREVQGAVNQLKPLDVSVQNQPALVDLMIEQKNLKNKIKQVDNSSLTKAESARLSEIDTELNNLVTQDRISKNIKGAETFIEGLEGVGLENIKGTEDLISSVEAIEANGGEVVGLARDEKGNILPAEDQNYGFISRMGDGTTQIILNEVSALKDNVATTAQHEVLHALLDKIFVNNSAAKIDAGKKLEALLNSDGIEMDALLTSRLDQVNKQFKDGDINEDQYYEEVFTLTSEGLSNDQIVENKTLLDKFTDFGRTLKSIFSGGKLNISFKTGRSALDFVKGYNKAIKSGKGADVAAKTGTIKGTETTEQGKARTSERIYQKVESLKDKLVDPNTKQETAFEIANDPAMFNEIDRRLKFDADAIAREDVIRNFLYDESRGMLGLLKGYDPARNDSIMGYLNSSTAGGKLLDARLFEFFKDDPRYERIIQSTTDENIQRKIESKTTSGKTTTTKPKARARTTPKASRKYPSTILGNLGISTKAEVDALFEEAIADDIANFYKGEIKEFKDIKDIGPAVAALMEKATGLKANRFSKKNQNIMKGDVESGAVTALQQLLNANADADFAMLAEAANIEGKSTSIPGKILEALFTKNSKDKYVRDTRKGLRDYKNVIDALNLEAKVKKGKDAIYRSADAQALKGLANLSLRNLIFEQAVPDPVARTRTGARFSQKQKTQRKQRFEVSGRDGIKVMRDTAKRFAKATNTKVLVDGKELTADNFNSKNPEAKKYLKDKLENDLWKYMPLESLTRGTMVDYSTKGDRSFFFDKTEFAEILEKARKNREAWIKEGNKLDYDTKAVDIAKASISPVKSAIHYLTNFSRRAKIKIDQNNKGVEAILQGGANAIKADAGNYLTLLAIYGTQSDSTSHLIRNMAVDAGVTEAYVNEKGKGKTVKEHVEPSNEMAPLMFEAQLFDEVGVLMPVIEKVYYQLGITKIQDGKLSDTDGKFGESYNYITTQVEFFQNGLREYFKTGDVSKIPDPLVRYFNPEVNRNDNGDGIPGFNANEMIVKGKTVAEMFTRQLPKSDQNPNNIFVQNDLTHQVLTGQITQAEAVKLLNNQISTNNLKARQSKKVNDMQPNNLKFEGTTAENSTAVVDELNKLDKALNQGRKTDKPVKKIRVFDFDDTLARSNSKVIVIKPIGDIDTDMLDIVARRKFKKEFENLPSRLQSFNNLNESQKQEVLKETPGATSEINATQFAEQAADLEAQGATFDFSQFEQVIDGKKGPLFDVAKKIADTRGAEDLFILTARPQTAAGPIKAFMKALGIDIPLGNITGLANGKAAAKGRWIAGKAAEGYNDFYFADDAGKNVKAVKDVLDQIDVKSRVQQARASKKQTFDTVVNDMIEDPLLVLNHIKLFLLQKLEQ